MPYFALDWLGLSWTAWSMLRAGKEEQKIVPVSQGVYRVRPFDKGFLAYIGQTNNLKNRLSMLRSNCYWAEMPWNDPHTAAPNLWVWRQEEGWDYEVSVASTPGLTTQNREGLECFLLWKYRFEKGESTICNHGRFHPDYIKSSDRGKGKRGRKLSEEEDRNPAWGPSHPSLKHVGVYASADWMGFPWTEFEEFGVPIVFPNEPGIYRIIDPKTGELMYVGETTNLRDRLGTHKRRFTDSRVSFSVVPRNMPHYQRLEIENDLIGQYYESTGKTPACQFLKRKLNETR